MKEYLKYLNAVQYEAVTTTEGPLLVVAGAGSGKTRVLTSRVAHIIDQHLAEPSGILAVTFTNKAAREMKERIINLLGLNNCPLTISTFHSFCAYLLRREATAVGYPSNFTIFDEDDALALIKNCLDELNLSRSQFTPKSLRRKISGAKNGMEDARDFSKKASGYFEERTASIYDLYERRLQECGAFDFDDLIYRSVRLLGSREDIRKKYTDRLRYILVDEYQDTNHSQYQLLRFLVGPHENICAVGDEDQSIYGWRGADITNILNFEKDFPDARVIKMEQNYRSTGNILEAASEVISNNVSRKNKILRTEQDAGEKINLFLTDSASEEAGAIIDSIERNRSRYKLKDMAILYRTNAQSRAFEEHLRRFDMPYQIIGGVAFYQRKEIKDVIAYLKFIANPRDDISMQRIINYPRRGIGNTTIGKLRECAAKTGKSMFEICLNIDKQNEFGSRSQKLLGRFAKLVSNYMEKKTDQDIAAITQELIDELRLTELLIEEDPIIGPERAKNVEEFIAAAEEFGSISDEPSLDNFLAEISLYTDIDQYNEIDDKLTLMTLHSAKGLEFDAVFISGLEEGLFPLARAVENQMEMEEERRLFYVGATRARWNLYLSMAVSRGRYGESEAIPSRFLKELPPGLVDIEDLRRFRSAGYGRTRSVIKSNEVQSEQVGIRYEYEEDELLRVGRIVQHPTFGRGKVVNVEGTGESLRLEIHFTGVGIKKIIPRYARLKVIG